MLDPRLLRAFTTIADVGSFTLAADRLHTTQSTISLQLGRLEQAVGQVLIHRTVRPARPTEAGERLLGHARRILALQDEAEKLLSDPAGTTSVRIGVPDDMVTPQMSKIFAVFSEQHRGTRLDVATGLSRDLARQYRAGDFDIVVVREPTPSVDHRATFPEAMGWFASASAPCTWDGPVPLVAFPVGGLYREAMLERLERERRRWHIAFTGSSLNSVLLAIEAGLGLSLIPTEAKSNYEVRPFEHFGKEAAMAVSVYSWERSCKIAELVELTIAVLAERFSVQVGFDNDRYHV